MRYLPLLLLLLLATSCFQQPVTRSVSENNRDYTVDYLFEHDGCKVYRFYDRGHYVYFTNCNGQTIAGADSTAVRNSIHVTKTPPAARSNP